MKYRPFRSPHHTMSRIGLIGGGAHPLPGEISLAHRGVLFLDELPEFPRHVMEALRQPMEDGNVSISRAAGSVSYPCKCMMVAAANPCPCGNFGSISKRCSCPPGVAGRYQKRISGPLLDRIDLHLFVQSVKVEDLTTAGHHAEPSKIIQDRVEAARSMQKKRYRGTLFAANADLTTKAIKTFCLLTSEAETMLRSAVGTLGLSARSFYRVIKVARSIADLELQKQVEIRHVAEALQFRPKDINL